MASLIPEYEYDIFISYRQKDNKYDGWVTEFVSNLKSEIEASFREELSVYFDMNSSDGLLETYDVNDSLKGKLKCLIFIPVISRSYCDPRSYAWQHEFKAFIDSASKDRLGLKVKLPNGNVVSRVLPVRIYDLSSKEVESCEAVTGGVLRGIDFIFRSSGVNRPLRAHEDHPGDNINKIYYRDQINKVANSIKEIIDACTSTDIIPVRNHERLIKKQVMAKAKKIKLLVGLTTFLVFLSTGIIFSDKIFIHEIDKSLAVLPFSSFSDDPEQESFGKNISEGILIKLFLIKGLKMPSSTESFRFRDSNLSTREIAHDLNVSYILTGNITVSDSILQVVVHLINGKDGSIKWLQPFKKTFTTDNLFELQSEVARQVAQNLEIEIDTSADRRIDKKSTTDLKAYQLFLEAKSLFPENREAGMELLKEAIKRDPNYADAYALMANYWIGSGTLFGLNSREVVLANAEPLIAKAFQLDPGSVLAHVSNAMLSLWYHWDYKKTEEEYNFIKDIQSDDFNLTFFSIFLTAKGDLGEAIKLCEKNLEMNKNSPIPWSQLTQLYFYNEEPEKAIDAMKTANKIFPDNKNFVLMNSVRLYLYLEKYEEAIELFEKYEKANEEDIMPCFLGYLGVAYYKTGNTIIANEYLKELLSRKSKSSVGSPAYFAAAVYTAMSMYDEALKALNKSYEDHEVEMYWLKVEPLFRPLHGNQEFKKLLIKMRLE